MTNLEGVTDALADLARAVPGLAAEDGTVQVFIGPHESWPSTPAAEVIADDMAVQSVAAGGWQQLITGFWHVVFYVQLVRNMDVSERLTLPLADAFLAIFRDPGFDRTLGGLVEDVRPVRVSFDVTRREGLNYRVASVTLEVGTDLEG